MVCESWKTKLDTYLDDEVPEEEVRTLDAHLRSCHFCSADALARVQMKRAIQVAGKRFTPTAEFHRRVRHGIAPKPQGSLGLGCMFVAAAVMVVLGTFQASKELDPAEIKFLARLQTCTWQRWPVYRRWM